MKNLRDITLRKVFRKVSSVTYDWARNPFMIRDGLHPKGTFTLSASQRHRDLNELPPRIELPNLSKHYHSVTRSFWEFYGLGDKCLLVSENYNVRCVMQELYPSTTFVTTDYFTELQTGLTDVVWNVCMPPPAELKASAFSSIIASALLEHLIDPTSALAHFFQLLRPNGHLFAHTHTPSYPLHRYPRDYVRFHHDYFEDMAGFLSERYELHVSLKELWSRRGHVIVCFEKKGIPSAF